MKKYLLILFLAPLFSACLGFKTQQPNVYKISQTSGFIINYYANEKGEIDGIEKGFDAKTKKLVFERTWKNGKKHGLWREYYPNSKLKYEGFYKDNLPTGTWKFYTPQGELESIQEY